MDTEAVIGWDLGGAHTKAALVDGEGQLRRVVQVACPLWYGLDRLDAAMRQILGQMGSGVRRHAVTMTGELADLFPDRGTGVKALTEASARQLRDAEMLIYAGPMGFRRIEETQAYVRQIGSANWLAATNLVAHCCEEGVFIDIGSTTTDIVPFLEGETCNRGYTDFERMRYEELVYTGVVRTPVMGVTDRVPFEGEWRPLAAERFATMADVYRLIGVLPDHADMTETCDGAGKTEQDSARRLARMVGCDLEPGGLERWRRLARYIAREQLLRIQRALERVVSCRVVSDDAPLVGAGTGRFLVCELAALAGRPYVDFSELIQGPDEVRDWAAICAPAVAVAQLLCRSYVARPELRYAG